MDTTQNQPSARRFWTWFVPLRRDIGSWAFALNRITAIGLTIYLFLHLIILGQLAQGPGAYDQFLLLTENPFIKFGEWLVVAAAILHGLNGIRITEAAARGVKRLYLLTETAVEFFTQLGYAAIPRETAPPAIRATTQFNSLCPASSSLLTKSIT